MNTPILRISDFQNAVKRVITPESGSERLLSSDHDFVPDRHQGGELLVNLKGKCDYPLNGKLFTLTPGTAVLIPPWCQHSFGYRPCDHGLLHLWFHFHTTCFGHGIYIRHGKWDSCPELSFSVSQELHTLFSSRWKSWKETGQPGNENLYFRNILNLFLDELQFHGRREVLKRNDIVSETLDLIRSANGRGCTLTHLAKQSGTSKYYLAHRIKEETGRSIGSFICEARLQYVDSAKKHGLTQKEIAYNLGFSSAASFWNWYHREQR